MSRQTQPKGLTLVEVFAREAEERTMLNWLIDHLHLIKVNTHAAYCNKRKRPSAAFQSLEVCHMGRHWNIRGGSRKRLIEAIRLEMERGRGHGKLRPF